MKNVKNFLPHIFIFAVALQFNVLAGRNFHAIATAHAQTTVVISDTLFNPADWSMQDSSQFGASQTNMQELTGGNGGAFRSMQHILPPPPGSSDLGFVEVTHIYETKNYDPSAQGTIDRIDYSEDMILLSVPWTAAFIRSFLAIEQNGQVFRSSNFLQIVAMTSWTNNSLSGLTAADFVALDSSSNKPDFSESGGILKFGYYRGSSRLQNSPVPASQNLIYEHGIDNFTVTILSSEPTTVVRDNLQTFPANFILQQNFPNPFNPSTTISYSLPQAAEVELTIFDVQGREVRMLQKGRQEAGNHQFDFEAVDLASGVYFYRLHAGSFVQTHKMLLLR